MRMNPGNGLKSYRQISLETAPPGNLVLMLYDGALRFLGQARAGFDLEDPLERNQTIHNNVVKTQNILEELGITLNLEAGGELAETLRDLYLYMGGRLMESNFNKDPEGIDEVLERLSVIRDAWATMLEQPVEGSGNGDLTLSGAVG